MKPLFLRGACALLMWLMSWGAHAQTEWRLATGYRAESFHTRNLMEFAAEVARATGGALRIDVQPNNALLRLPEIVEGVRQGRAEAGEAILTGMVAEWPLAGADAVPFVVGSYDDAERLWRLQRPLLERHLGARGLVVLYAVPWPPQGLYSRTPVARSADLAGSRMRTYNQTTVRIAEFLGAAPVDVAMVEVGRAAAEGRMDSMITSAVTGVENRVWEHLHHYYEINAWFPKNLVFVSEAAWRRLDDATRDAVRQAADRAQTRGWAMSRDEARSATQTLAAQGMQVERAPREFEAELRRLGERFSREWVRRVGHEANAIFVPYYFQTAR